MIAFTYNDRPGQVFIDVDGGDDDGPFFALTVKDEESFDGILDVTLDDPAVADEFLAEVTAAVEKFKAAATAAAPAEPTGPKKTARP